MNYQFPVISNISQILPAIAGSPEFVVAERDGHIIINYNVMMNDTFPPIKVSGGSTEMRAEREFHNAIRRECRGIIFDSVTGNIIRRPLHKFMNVNEREETLEKNIDLSKPHVILEKLDGSMIAVFKLKNKLIWGTKMVAQEFHEMVEKFVQDSKIDYVNFCEDIINSGYTPIFEWMHPEKRIVIDYKTPSLVLIAIRHINSGVYVPLHT
jgi:RNA ligase